MAFQLNPNLLTRPPEPSGFARGASRLGNVLDAMMARREAKKQWEAEQQAAQQRADGIRQEQAQRIALEAQRAQQQAERDRMTDERGRADLALRQQQAQAGVMKDVSGMLGTEEGQAAVVPYLRSAGVGVRQSQGRPARPSVEEEAGGEITSSIPQTAEDAGTYLQFSGGAEARLPLEQMLPAERAERVRQALGGLSPNDPMVARQLGLVAPLVGAGLNAKDAVGAASGLFDDTAAMERARLRAQRAGAKKPVDPRKAQKADLDIETKFDNVVQKVLQNRGYKEIRTQEIKFEDMANTIAGASDSAALASLGSGQFVKMAQGGVGVISDNDMRVFWNRIGGLGARGEQAFHDAVSGRLGAEKKRDVLQAVKVLESKARTNVDDIGKAIADRLSGVEGGEERIETYLSTYAPGYLEKWQAGRAKGGDAGAESEQIQEEESWLEGLK